MALRRRRSGDGPDGTEATDGVDDESSPEPVDVRHAGPWDLAERPRTDDPAVIDLGSLLVTGREGLTVQLPEEQSGVIASVVLVSGGSAMELRAFADSRSGGLWSEVLEGLEREVVRVGGTSETRNGPYGTELRVEVSGTMQDDGAEGVQVTRILGIEGPRWLLRATVHGDDAFEPRDDGVLMDALRDVVVVRGDGPMAPREPLLLRLPGPAGPAPAGE